MRKFRIRKEEYLGRNLDNKLTLFEEYFIQEKFWFGWQDISCKYYDLETAKEGVQILKNDIKTSYIEI